MKKLVFGLIAMVTFGFVGNAQTIEELRKSNNQYNSKGEAFYDYLKDVSTSVKEGRKSLDEISVEINSESFGFKTNLDEEGVATYEEYFKDKTINLQNLMSFENHVLENEVLSKNIKLLESIAIIKWGNFYCEEFASRTLAGFEICLDRCIAKKARALFQNSNWVEQAGFIAFAAESFAWWVASCSWDCR